MYVPRYVGTVPRYLGRQIYSISKVAKLPSLIGMRRAQSSLFLQLHEYPWLILPPAERYT